MSAESKQSGLSFQMEGEALAVQFNGKLVPAHKIDPLMALLQGDMERRVKQLEAYVPLMCKNETAD